jgi:hypothetical protein
MDVGSLIQSLLAAILGFFNAILGFILNIVNLVVGVIPENLRLGLFVFIVLLIFILVIGFRRKD